MCLKFGTCKFFGAVMRNVIRVYLVATVCSVSYHRQFLSFSFSCSPLSTIKLNGGKDEVIQFLRCRNLHGNSLAPQFKIFSM